MSRQNLNNILRKMQHDLSRARRQRVEYQAYDPSGTIKMGIAYDCLTERDARELIVSTYAPEIRAAYNDLCPPREHITPDGFVFVGRAKDGSYIHSRDGQTKRRVAKRSFPADYYRLDECIELVMPDDTERW
jgi:hypothetical protein